MASVNPSKASPVVLFAPYFQYYNCCPSIEKTWKSGRDVILDIRLFYTINVELIWPTYCTFDEYLLMLVVLLYKIVDIVQFVKVATLYIPR